MSYDPFAYSSEPPPDSGAPLPPPSADQARQRVQAPAIGLIVAGVLNLLMAAWPALQAFQASMLTPEQLQKEMEKQNPSAEQQMKQLGWTPEGVLRGFTWGYSVWSLVDFLMALLVLFGGIRMLGLRSYGLAVFASLLAAVPFVSCSACCGLGEIVGLWALIVLINPDVKAAFR